MIAAPRAGVVKTEFADDPRYVDTRAGRVEAGGKAQVDLIGAGSQDARGYCEMQRAETGRELFERIGAGVHAVAFIDDRAVETLQGHVSVEAGHFAGRFVFDADMNGVIAIESIDRSPVGLALGRHAADVEWPVRGARLVAQE